VIVVLHQVNNVSVISYQEQVTFWWDDDICFDIISRTGYILMISVLDMISKQISSSHQKVTCSWYDIKTDIIISSKGNLFLIWYQNRYHHLIKR
jgi:hypothetical protein